MNRIYKYLFDPGTREITLALQFARLDPVRFDVDTRSGVPALWFEVGDNYPHGIQTFRIVATGEDYDPAHHEWVATMRTGVFVFHLLRKYTVAR